MQLNENYMVLVISVIVSVPQEIFNGVFTHKLSLNYGS